jgi:hypothetical protein
MGMEAFFRTLWGKKFFDDILNSALQYGPDPSNDLIFALAIQKLLKAKRKSK